MLLGGLGADFHDFWCPEDRLEIRRLIRVSLESSQILMKHVEPVSDIEFPAGDKGIRLLMVISMWDPSHNVKVLTVKCFIHCTS